jgi:hypothetical protein
MRTRVLYLILAAASVAALAPATASASASESSASSDDRPRTVDVDVRIQRFAVQGRKVKAKGVAKVGLADGGQAQTASKPVTFQVRRTAGCRVLTLQLDDLHLELLGLIVDTSAVNLNITGRRSGGALGQLFCQLSRGIRLKSRAAAVAASRSLNRRLRGKPMRAIAFKAQVRPVDQNGNPASSSSPDGEPQAQAAQAATTCQVLDLILGPLNLDLLGLRVDLYGATTKLPVRVLIVADPAKGVLGQVFCRLARGEAQS